MMLKTKIITIILLVISSVSCFGQIFNTSKCFDLLCSPQYIETLKEDSRFIELFTDSLFINSLSDVNSNSRASQLCNLYTEVGGSKDDVSQCLQIVQNLDSIANDIEWANNILSVQPQLSYILQKLVQNGYSEYWDEKVLPELKSHIDNYSLNQILLDSINVSIINFAKPETLPDTRSKIFILNIDNAFNLSDESFCCTPLILNSVIEKQLRLNFVNVYIHENLHSLKISPILMAKLSELKNDPFYKVKGGSSPKT